MTDKSQESLYLQSLGTIEVRGLTQQEVALLWQGAKRTAHGNQSAIKGALLIGCLSLGIFRPRMKRPEIEAFIKHHAKEAAQASSLIIILTTSAT